MFAELWLCCERASSPQWFCRFYLKRFVLLRIPVLLLSWSNVQMKDSFNPSVRTQPSRGDDSFWGGRNESRHTADKAQQHRQGIPWPVVAPGMEPGLWESHCADVRGRGRLMPECHSFSSSKEVDPFCSSALSWVESLTHTSVFYFCPILSSLFYPYFSCS